MKQLTLAAIIAWLLLTPAFAQQPSKATTPPAESKPAAEIPKLVESIDVRIINVDVVVTDKKGNTITGLKREDFDVYENDVLKPITNFFEVEGRRAINAVTEVPTHAQPAPAAAAPAATSSADTVPDSLKRRIIFYIDNLSLAPLNRNKVFAQMKDFARNTMRPGDEAMIATFNRSMKVRVPFTRDVTQIEQTLDSILGESAMGASNRSERTDVENRIRDTDSYDEAIATARTYASSVEHDLRQSVSSINALMSTLAGVEGKKILVLTSEGFQMSPGKEVFYFIEDLSRERTAWQNAGSTIIEGMTFDAASLIQSVAKTANANNITLYTIHAAGLGAGNENSAENAHPTSFTVSQAAISNSTDSMQLMAEMTGGLASLQTNNFALAFKRIQRDLDSYYSLGYRGGTERVDRQRALQVRVKNRAYVVRARQTFVEKSTFAEMNDRVIANLLYKTKSNDLHILVKVDTPQAADDLFKVPVEIQIPMESLALLPQGNDYVGGFDVYVAVANKDNDMSDVARKNHEIRVPAADYPKLKGKFYTYTLDLLMERGLNRISIGVVDNVVNTTGFAREQIIAQDLR
ncbi:MAG TPA: VWA domain-containing protein [Thermoanaerobaculia bacterium]|nr:VWA domain-containing protein [Thermoanaerobaculia bacterium]